MLTYALGVYLIACIAIYAIVRATVANSVLRAAFLFIGCFAPFFFLYVLISACFSKERTTEAEAAQISATADAIEKERQRKFGSVVLPSHRLLKIEYVRALNKATGTLERVIEKTA
jgi:hypothetical protein